MIMEYDCTKTALQLSVGCIICVCDAILAISRFNSVGYHMMPQKALWWVFQKGIRKYYGMRQHLLLVLIGHKYD